MIESGLARNNLIERRIPRRDFAQNGARAPQATPGLSPGFSAIDANCTLDARHAGMMCARMEAFNAAAE
jgi:hypothetical protein